MEVCPFLLRPMSEADLSAVCAIEAETVSPWSAGQLAGELSREDGWQFVAQAVFPENVVAYVLGRLCAGEAELLKIAVSPAHRRQGLAARLLAHALRHLANHGAERCLLELRAGNQQALAMYEKSGFRCIGLRKNYYHSPPDDAIVMEKVILPPGRNLEGKDP